ncbi:MAG: toxin-antitoxin system HicB family antitoxin [Acidobacteria bacterium]|nr:MAG: toxin-antitoxin system HicB family antitoxin [Acidobacteriota bacterium]
MRWESCKTISNQASSCSTFKAKQYNKYKTGINIDKYDDHVTWSKEDQVFIGRVTEFPSLAALGSSLDGALYEIHQVVGMVLEELKETGLPIPEPFCMRNYSGRVNLRMPVELH